MTEFKIASETTIKAAVIVAQVIGLQKELEEIKEAVKATERKGPAYKILQKVQKETEAKIAEVEETNYFLASEAVEEVESVTIFASEYDSLLKASNQLDHLEANGVDNWEGYTVFDEEEEEEEGPPQEASAI